MSKIKVTASIMILREYKNSTKTTIMFQVKNNLSLNSNNKTRVGALLFKQLPENWLFFCVELYF